MVRRLGDLCCYLLAFGLLLALLLGVRPVVTHGVSMEPSISEGTLLLAAPVAPSELRPGDVAIVRYPDGRPIAHRVVSVEPSGDSTSLVMRGDNNPADDPAVTASTAQRVFATLPGGGVLASPLLWLLLAAAFLFLRRR